MYHAKIVYELIQLGGIQLRPAKTMFDKFGKEAANLEFNVIASMLFNSAVDDSIPCISRLVDSESSAIGICHRVPCRTEQKLS